MSQMCQQRTSGACHAHLALGRKCTLFERVVGDQLIARLGQADDGIFAMEGKSTHEAGAEGSPNNSLCLFGNSFIKSVALSPVYPHESLSDVAP